MISIITPAYIDTIEKLEWLNEMLASVRTQTLTEWEVIIMDDASPLPINLYDTDSRVRTLRMVTHSGPSLCRNTAVALARYQALFPLDADDLLPSNEVLNKLYQVWLDDRTKIVYGDLQRLENIEGNWQYSKLHKLPEYRFTRPDFGINGTVLDPGGTIPVSALHSIECHHKAGGWKASLEAGLEDVEYWIAAGKSGFCGQHIDEVTLLYRKHDESRSSILRRNKRETEMRNRIRQMHQDVYEGRYPMGCCGGGAVYIPPSGFSQQSVSAPLTLDQYASNEKVWVEYVGQRQGSFGLVGQFTNYPYTVDGPEHKIEVHIGDLPKFRHSGRGADFKIGVPAPNGFTPPAATGPQPFEAQAPELAQILQLDEIASAA